MSKIFIQGLNGGGSGNTMTQEKKVDLDFSNGKQIVLPDDEYELSKVEIQQPEDLTSDNIRRGKNIAGIEGKFEGSLFDEAPYPELEDYVYEEPRFLARVVDYDGTIVKEEWLKDDEIFSFSTELLPEHERLQFDGWSVTQEVEYLNEEKTAGQTKVDFKDIAIGAIYTTKSDKIEIDAEIDEESGLDIDVGLHLDCYYNDITEKVVFDWGDGTIEEVTIGGTFYDIEHHYSKNGQYTILIENKKQTSFILFLLQSKNSNYVQKLYCPKWCRPGAYGTQYRPMSSVINAPTNDIVFNGATVKYNNNNVVLSYKQNHMKELTIPQMTDNGSHTITIVAPELKGFNIITNARLYGAYIPNVEAPVIDKNTMVSIYGNNMTNRGDIYTTTYHNYSTFGLSGRIWDSLTLNSARTANARRGFIFQGDRQYICDNMGDNFYVSKSISYNIPQGISKLYCKGGGIIINSTAMSKIEMLDARNADSIYFYSFYDTPRLRYITLPNTVTFNNATAIQFNNSLLKTVDFSNITFSNSIRFNNSIYLEDIKWGNYKTEYPGWRAAGIKRIENFHWPFKTMSTYDIYHSSFKNLIVEQKIDTWYSEINSKIDNVIFQNGSPKAIIGYINNPTLKIDLSDTTTIGSHCLQAVSQLIFNNKEQCNIESQDINYLKDLEIPNTITWSTFSLPSIRNLKVNGDRKEVKNLCNSSYYLDNLSLSNSIETIDYSFQYTSLKSIELPQSIKTISDSFVNNYIETLQLPDSLETIENSFTNAKIKDIHLNQGTSNLSQKTSFSNFSSLRYFEVPDKWEIVDLSLFTRYVKLVFSPNTQVKAIINYKGNVLENLPETIEFIQPSAPFNSCETKVYKNIQYKSAFNQPYTHTSITSKDFTALHPNVKYADQYLCSSMNFSEIGFNLKHWSDKIKGIPDYCFYNITLPNSADITIPNYVSWIGTNGFYSTGNTMKEANLTFSENGQYCLFNNAFTGVRPNNITIKNNVTLKEDYIGLNYNTAGTVVGNFNIENNVIINTKIIGNQTMDTLSIGNDVQITSPLVYKFSNISIGNNSVLELKSENNTTVNNFTIGNNCLTTIGPNCFRNTTINNFTFGENNSFILEDSAFYNASFGNFDASSFINSIKTWNNNACYGMTVDKLIIPSSVQLQTQSFYGVGVNSLTIESNKHTSVSGIKNIKDLTLSILPTYHDNYYEYQGGSLAQLFKLNMENSISKVQTLLRNDSTVTVTAYIPSTLESITVLGGDVERYALNNCPDISLIFKNNNDEHQIVYTNGFSGLSKTITFEDNTLTEIKTYGFVGMSNLQEINIPKSLKEIDTWSFYECKNLATVYWNAIKAKYKLYTSNNNTYRNSIFYNIANNCTIYIGDEVESIPAYFVCYNSSSNKGNFNIILNDTHKKERVDIGDYAFWGEKVDFSNSSSLFNKLGNLGTSCFYSGKNLPSFVDIKGNVGDSCFINTDGIKSVNWDLGESNIIYNYCFYNAGLESLTIHTNQEYLQIRDNAFSNNPILKIESIKVNQVTNQFNAGTFVNCEFNGAFYGQPIFNNTSFKDCDFTVVERNTDNNAVFNYCNFEGNITFKDLRQNYNASQICQFCYVKDDSKIEISNSPVMYNFTTWGNNSMGIFNDTYVVINNLSSNGTSSFIINNSKTTISGVGVAKEIKVTGNSDSLYVRSEKTVFENAVVLSAATYGQGDVIINNSTVSRIRGNINNLHVEENSSSLGLLANYNNDVIINNIYINSPDIVLFYNIYTVNQQFNASINNFYLNKPIKELYNKSLYANSVTINNFYIASSGYENMFWRYGPLYSNVYFQTPVIESNSIKDQTTTFNIILTDKVEEIKENAIKLNYINLSGDASNLKIIQNNAWQGQIKTLPDLKNIEYIGDDNYLVLYLTSSVNNYLTTTTHNISHIGANAFYSTNENGKLSSKHVFKNVSYIGEYAFIGQSYLKNIVFNETTEVIIKQNAFYNINFNNGFIIPSNVTVIEANAFYTATKNSGTIYVIASSKPAGWADNWQTNHEVIWGTEKNHLTLKKKDETILELENYIFDTPEIEDESIIGWSPDFSDEKPYNFTITEFPYYSDTDTTLYALVKEEHTITIKTIKDGEIIKEETSLMSGILRDCYLDEELTQKVSIILINQDLVLYKKEFNYVVESAGTTYSFSLADDGYYENPQMSHNQFALSKMTIEGASALITWTQESELGYDFGLISLKDQTLTANTNVDSNVSLNAQSKASGTLTLEPGVYYVKYRKDNSKTTGIDKFRFKIERVQ